MLSGIQSVKSVLVGHSALNVPTTFDISNNHVLMLANSQMDNLNQDNNQIIKQGLIPLLIDKDGNTCTIDKMHTSKTFWLQQQQNLMVADNQTEIYANALPQQKMIMSKKAWGKYA